MKCYMADELLLAMVLHHGFSPVQVIPFPVYPSLQAHMNLSARSVQFASEEQV